MPCQVIAVKAFINQIQQRVPSAAAKLACLHRNEPLWLEAGAEYVRSGGYKRVVGPDLIKTITMPTMVIWGGEDPILPVADATVCTLAMRSGDFESGESVARLLAHRTAQPMDAIGYYHIRPPVHSVTLGELAAQQET